MSDLVERLRKAGDPKGNSAQIACALAADELARLRAEKAELIAVLDRIAKMKPEQIGDSPFMTGPKALLDACQREARAALARVQSQPHDSEGETE